MNKIKFYGANWCGDCIRAKAILDNKKIDYQYINIDEIVSAATEVERLNGGNRSVPTIVFPDGSILVEPSNDELHEKLQMLE